MTDRIARLTRPWKLTVLGPAAALGAPSPAWCEAVAPGRTVGDVLANLLISVVFGVVGMALLIGGYYVFELLTSYSISKELVEDHNVAVGVVVAAVILGLAIVIAASIL